MMLTDSQRIAWLRLIRSEKIGPRTFRILLNRFGSAEAALEALPRIGRRNGIRPHITSVEEAVAEIERGQKLGVQFVALGEASYPKFLQQDDDAPPLLLVRGQLSVLQQPMISIVGARNASAAGLVFAERLTRSLCRESYVIVSGLARGIDTHVHQSALISGTIAVLAGGQDKIYPPENTDLVERILNSGAIVTEMPMGWEARGRDFPRRNRIVAGLSQATIVVEAARRSGSLITAKFALDRGREVFAVPGSPLDPRAEGTNDLLREGATLCTKGEDVLEVLQGSLREEEKISNRHLFQDPPLVSGEPLWDELELSEGPKYTIPTDVYGEDESDIFSLFYSSPASFQEPESSGSHPLGNGPDESMNSLSSSNNLVTSSVSARSGEDGQAAEKILHLLGPTPLALEDIAQVTGLPPHILHRHIMELEIANHISKHEGNRISRKLG